MSPLDTYFLQNSLRAWLIAGSIFVVVAGGLLLARRAVARRLGELAARTATEADDAAVDLLLRTRLYFVAAVALMAALQVLDATERVRATARWLSIVALVLQVGVWGNGLITYWLREWAEKRGDDRGSATTIAAFGALARFALWLVLGLVALQNLGVNVTTLVTGLGITGVAVALAVQNILGDLFAALSIVVDKPFVVGDTIAIDTFTGTVEKIGLKTTRVRALSGELVILSNADLLRSRVRNITSMRERRVLVTHGVPFDTPADMLTQIPALLRAAVQGAPQARFERSHLARIGESAIEFESVYWVESPDFAVYMDVAQAVNLGILRSFADQKVAFAFPTRTVVVQGGPLAGSGAATEGAGDSPPPRGVSA